MRDSSTSDDAGTQQQGEDPGDTWLYLGQKIVTFRIILGSTPLRLAGCHSKTQTVVGEDLVSEPLIGSTRDSDATQPVSPAAFTSANPTQERFQLRDMEDRGIRIQAEPRKGHLGENFR